MVYAGVALLTASYFTWLGRFNAVLVAGLLLVVGGAWGYVKSEKVKR